MSDSMYGLDAEDPDAPLEPADVDTLDTEVEVDCPYCGEVVTIGADPAGGAVQTLCRGLSGVLSAVAGTPQLR